MKVECPSGHVVELRERVSNADRKAYVKAQEEGPREEVALQIPVTDDAGEPVLDGAGDPMFETRAVKTPTALSSLEISNTVLSMLIESWTYEFEIPSVAPTPERRDEILDLLLDIEDYDCIAEKARPVIGKMFVSAKPSMNPKDGSPTGPSSD